MHILHQHHALADNERVLALKLSAVVFSGEVAGPDSEGSHIRWNGHGSGTERQEIVAVEINVRRVDPDLILHRESRGVCEDRGLII
jgi:hypothetical protein